MGVAAGDGGGPRPCVASLGPQRGDGAGQGLGVPTVAVHEHHAGEMIGRPAELDEHHLERGMADRQRAGKVGVLPARSVGDRRGHDDVVDGGGEPLGQGLGDAGVGVERQVRTVLFARADGNDEQWLRRRYLGPRGSGQCVVATIGHGISVPVSSGRTHPTRGVRR